MEIERSIAAPHMRIDRNITDPQMAANQIKNDPFLSELLKEHIEPKVVRYGNIDSVFNPRVIFALRNGETDISRIMLYCMGGKICELERGGNYDPVINTTYVRDGNKQIESIIKEIQIRSVLNEGNYEKLYDSYFYGLNPLCGKRDSLFLIDIEAAFTQRGIRERNIIDLVFLKYVNDVPNLLFIESKQANNKDNKPKRQQNGKWISDTRMQLDRYQSIIESDRANIIEQYNHVISFYNLFGLNLKLLDAASQIRLGLVVYAHEGNKAELDSRRRVMFDANKIILPMTKTYPVCPIDIKCTFENNRTSEKLDEEFEKKAISCIEEFAESVFNKTGSF